MGLKDYTYLKRNITSNSLIDDFLAAFMPLHPAFRSVRVPSNNVTCTQLHPMKKRQSTIAQHSKQASVKNTLQLRDAV